MAGVVNVDETVRQDRVTCDRRRRLYVCAAAVTDVAARGLTPDQGWLGLKVAVTIGLSAVLT
jgi:hypothetical protein